MGILIFFLGLSTAVIRQAHGEEDLAQQREALMAISQELQELAGAEPAKAIPRLNQIVRETGTRGFFELEERWPVHSEARNLLTAIPGHAKYYRTFLGELRENLMAEREGKPLPHEHHSAISYDAQRLAAFETMAQVPSAEVVEILGEFLPDFEWIGYTGDPRHARRAGAIKPNGVLAGRSLAQLIDNPPLQMPVDQQSFDEAEMWQVWYRQVKEGRRTFRFKGDLRDYDLNGPQREGKAPITSRPSKETSKSDAPEVTSGTPRSRVIIFALAAVLCGIAAFRLFQHRSVREQ